MVMKIYFSDLAYVDDSKPFYPVPLNAGYIASYALKHLSDIEIRIFKDPAKLLEAVAAHPPDVLAMTYYGWNANLDAAIARRCKEIVPDLRIVLGGPNFDHDDNDRITEFFRDNQYVDLFITGEGELSFLRYLQILQKNDLDLYRSDPSQWPSSFYSFDHKSGQVIHTPMNPIGRMDLTEIPSPYLSGILDEFLDDPRFAPIIETNRGCPYSCSFCVWGQATLSVVRQFELQTVIDEINYIGMRSKNPTKIFYVADANFGMFKRDITIAEAFIACREKHARPERLYIYASKIQTKTTLQTFEILKPIAGMSMSLQSTNEHVLELIGRKNIGMENYEANRLEAERRGIRTHCELIYGLPGESYDSFADGISKVLKTGQERIQLYVHLLNLGADTATAASRERFGFKTAFRVQGLEACGTFGDVSTVEYEEIVIGSNDFSFDDYLRLRDLHLLVQFFASRAFKEFRRSLRGTEADIVMLSKFIVSDESNWPETFARVLKGFRQACQDELLTAEEIARVFGPADIKALAEKETMLVPSAICKFHARRSNLLDLQSYVAGVISQCFNGLSDQQREDVLQGFHFSMDRAIAYDDLQSSKTVEYMYDLDAWLSDEDAASLRDFRTERPMAYRLEQPLGLGDAFEKAVKAGCSLENAVYLLKFNFFPASEDRIFQYIRSAIGVDQYPVVNDSSLVSIDDPSKNFSLAVASSDSALERYSS